MTVVQLLQQDQAHKQSLGSETAMRYEDVPNAQMVNQCSTRESKMESKQGMHKLVANGTACKIDRTRSRHAKEVTMRW